MIQCYRAVVPGEPESSTMSQSFSHETLEEMRTTAVLEEYYVGSIAAGIYNVYIIYMYVYMFPNPHVEYIS